MSGLKPLIEHHVPENPVVQEKKITHAQQMILLQVYLADVLLFGAGTLDPEQQKLQDELQTSYLKGLKPGDIVEIGQQTMHNFCSGVVVENKDDIIKIKSSCYGNKKKKEGIRGFSAIDGYSKGFIMDTEYGDTYKRYFYINIPPSHTVQSTRGIPQEALDEIDVLYKQAGEPKTSYELVNNLKYGEDLPF